MMSIKDINIWNGRNTLEDLYALGIDPLISLSKMLDELEQIEGDDAGMAYTLNRTMYEGLLNLHDSLMAIWKSFPKEDSEAALQIGIGCRG